MQANLSFGSETGRTRSGTKVGSGNSKKKMKRKKQEYHIRRRAYIQESEHLNAEDVRARTVLALDRLGHQVLSTEPGGYDLEDWLRGLNSLLDDFQEKIGDHRIPEEFRRVRRQALLSFAQASPLGVADPEFEKLTLEEEAARAVLADLHRQAREKLASLREERDSCGRELKLEREKLAGMREAKEARKFFSRLVGGGPSTAQAEAKVAELESKLSRLEEEIDGSRKARAASGAGAGQTGSASHEAQERLEGVRDRLLELESAKLERLQLAREREAAAKAISESISSMRLEENPPGQGASQEL
ncbi:MAG TPA: hypothetical protein VEO75_01045 [Nitrososphaerales archaeon]|nr:hypothetical protein [Nitrososphaerales archaeon]